MQLTNRDDLHHLVLNAPMGICIVDTETGISELVNDRFLDLTGKSHDDVSNKPYRDLFAGTDFYHEPGLNTAIENGKTYHGHEVEILPNGSGKLQSTRLSFVYSPIKNNEERVTKIAVWAMENTSHLATQQKLDENAAALKEANEAMAATNEEMAATNEEMAATNEELAATIEELAATNEELVATNEEVVSVNEELVISKESVQRSEKLLRSIAVNLPNAVIVVIDTDHRYLLVEGDLMEKMGYNRIDYEGKHPTEIGQSERYNASKHLYDRMMAGEKFSLERKSATGENYIVHLVPLKNQQGDVYAGIVMAIDITDIKQAEEKSAKLAAIIESSDDAIVSKTLESVITSWNESAERMFGYSADEMIGETIYKIIPPERRDEEPEILSRLKTGERVEHFETKRLTKHGKLIDVSVTVSPIKDKAGNIIGLSKIARDITEQKLDETRKNDFIGMVSHELKTPLTSLTAIIQVVQAKLKNSGDSQLTNAMDRAALQVKRMTGMINGFLNISRLEAGKILIEKQPVNLSELLEDILAETQLIIGSHEISLKECDDVQIIADPDKISSVISNLISNAIKYSPKGKQIEITCKTNTERVIVSVKDEGMGIKPVDIDKIFDRYYRVETNHTRHISGFGIGLYLSSEIINRHDGEIWVESESGKGSTFYFSLPLA